MVLCVIRSIIIYITTNRKSLAVNAIDTSSIVEVNSSHGVAIGADCLCSGMTRLDQFCEPLQVNT